MAENGGKRNQRGNHTYHSDNGDSGIDLDDDLLDWDGSSGTKHTSAGSRFSGLDDDLGIRPGTSGTSGTSGTLGTSGRYRTAGSSSGRGRSTGTRSVLGGSLSSGKKRRRRRSHPILRLLVFLLVVIAAGYAANVHFHFVSDIREVPQLAQSLVSKVPELAQNLTSEVTDQTDGGITEDTGQSDADNRAQTGVSDGSSYAAQSTDAASVWEETVSEAAAADTGGLPGMQDDATEENLLNLLYLYDLDGAFFLNYALKKNSDFMTYFDGGDAVENVSTAVHEECHYFTSANAGQTVAGVTFFSGGRSQSVYVGEGYSIEMEITTVYDSQEMIGMIPDELRTFRFSTYVGEPDDNLASNVEGAYGLLNEFAAYCWGTNTSVQLFDYYKTQEQTPDTWLEYVSDCNTLSAYAEFRYYILTYLLYAASSHTDVYDGIMNNAEFVSAFCVIDDKFQEVISRHEANLDEIETVMTDAGYIVSNERDIYYIGTSAGSSGRGTGWDDYDILMDFMESDADYIAMYETLRGI